MDLGIDGRTALVAGGSAGLGKAAAIALAREGARLFISARGEARLRNTAEEIRNATGAEVSIIVANHATEEGKRRLYETCPTPDIVVFTFSPPPSTEDYRETTAEQWREIFDSVCVGSIELMRHYSSGMAQRKYGRIVNISTIAAKFPNEARMLSGASRAAIANYASAISKAVAKDNVAINSILPGLFSTEGMEDRFAEAAKREGATPEEERSKFLRRFRIPRRSLGEPEDVGALCAFLCSRYAGYVIGQSWVVDGGLGGGLY